MSPLQNFLERTKDDPSIGPIHVSLYAILLEIVPQREHFMRLHRREIMQMAHIRSRNTYSRVMRKLAELRVIEYEAKSGPGPSKVRLVR